MNRLGNEKALRIIDANLNRAREGLRVCEDIIRFILNDPVSTKRFKEIRHQLQDIVAKAALDCSAMYASRNSSNDVGKGPSHLEKKKNWQGVFFANIQRIKESLRVLEEFFRLSDASTAKRCKRLRFRIYEAEKNIVMRSKALSDCKYNPAER